MALLIIPGGKITGIARVQISERLSRDHFGYVYSLAQANRIICYFETSLFSNNILFQYSVEVRPTTRKSPLLRKQTERKHRKFFKIKVRKFDLYVTFISYFPLCIAMTSY